MIRWLFGQNVRNLSELFNANMVKYQQMRLQSLIKKNIQIITALCCNKKRFFSVKMDIYDVLLQLKQRYQTIFWLLGLKRRNTFASRIPLKCGQITQHITANEMSCLIVRKQEVFCDNILKH